MNKVIRIERGWAGHFIKQLSGICCHSALVVEGDKIMSCADAIAKTLKKHMDIKTELADKTTEEG